MENKKTLTISTRSLWGYDPHKMSLTDPDDRRTIIARVFDAGTYEDKRAILDFFDEAVIQEALLSAPELQMATIAFLCILFQKKPEDFRAFRRSQGTDMVTIHF